VNDYLVEYGAWVWKIAALVIALFGLVVVRAVRNTSARRRARDEVAVRTAKVSAPVLAKGEGLVTLAGTLRGGMATTLHVGLTGHHDRAGEVWVAYQNERLELSAPVRVVHGSTAAASRGLPRGTPRAIREGIARGHDDSLSRVSRVLRRAAGGSMHRLEQVRDGDAVLARGVLQGQTAGVDRFGLRAWILAPIPETGDIEVVAVSPDASAVPLREPIALVLALLIAGAACGGMYGLGQHELSVGSPRALAIAAAMPGSREAALAEIGKPKH